MCDATNALIIWSSQRRHTTDLSGREAISESIGYYALSMRMHHPIEEDKHRRRAASDAARRYPVLRQDASANKRQNKPAHILLLTQCVSLQPVIVNDSVAFAIFNDDAYDEEVMTVKLNMVHLCK